MRTDKSRKRFVFLCVAPVSYTHLIRKYFDMTKVLFICHGNICRSPMAECGMKYLVDKAGLSDQFEIASAATSTEEIGRAHV